MSDKMILCILLLSLVSAIDLIDCCNSVGLPFNSCGSVREQNEEKQKDGTNAI